MSSPDKPSIPFAPTLEVAGEPDVHLVLASMDDTPRLFELIESGRPYLERYQHWCQNVRSEDDARSHNQSVLHHMANEEWVQYRLVPGRADRPHPWVGTVTLYGYNPHEHTANFGYWLAEEAQGNGYALRGTERLLEYGRKVLGITQAVAHIMEGNERSEALAVRLQCRVTGEYPAIIDDGAAGRPVTIRRWLKEL